MSVAVRPATADDVPTILRFVRELAEYEREPEAVVATEEMLRAALFGGRPAAGTHQSSTLMGPAAEALIAERDRVAIGFAMFFHNFSTWTGRRGLYLEDLYVVPAARGSGAGKALLRHLAGIALDRGCARFEWSVLDWNTPAIDFYRAIGAVAMEEWTIQRVSGEALLKLAGARLMAWLWLVIGGLFEVGFTTCLRYVDSFRNVPWTIGFLVSVGVSMALLEVASRSIAMGTAYAVWGGIGALGTVIVGILWFGEPATPPRILLILGVVLCIAGLKLTAGK